VINKDDVVRAAGGHRQAVKVLRLLGQAEVVSGAELHRLADEIEQDDPPRDPKAGDPVWLRGLITELIPDSGLAFVRVHRTDPTDQRDWVVMQLGGLEFDSLSLLDGGQVSGEMPGQVNGDIGFAISIISNVDAPETRWPRQTDEWREAARRFLGQA
jgi:hypothetical protein